MKIKPFQIGAIPGILYGEPAKQGYLFLHGQMGCKEEAEAFAQVVCPRGVQVLSIDLPAHGERRERDEALLPWTAVPDIQAALDWAAAIGKRFPCGPTALGRISPCWPLKRRPAPCWFPPFWTWRA